MNEEELKADAGKTWAWLELHPLVLGVLIGIIVGLGAGAWIFGK